MKMILVDVSASDSWVSSCPLQDLNFINCHLMACDSQNGFPRVPQEAHVDREGRGYPLPMPASPGQLLSELFQRLHGELSLRSVTTGRDATGPSCPRPSSL